MTLEEVPVCPICEANSFSHFLTTRDYTVSQHDFQLKRCDSCGFLLTTPRPDQQSISAYYQSDKYISHSGGRKTLVDKIYLQARNITLTWKQQLIDQYASQGKILDYGCGTGEFLTYMQSKKWEIQGVEPSEAARKKAQQSTKKLIETELAAIVDTFDVITLWHVLEHVHDLNEKVAELVTRLNDDGTIFIAVPNHESKDAKKYGPHWAGYDVPRHLWHFSKTNMISFLQKHRLTILAVKPMKLDSYYVSMLSESYKNPSAFPGVSIARAIASGLQSNLQAAKTGAYSSLIYIAKRA